MAAFCNSIITFNVHFLTWKCFRFDSSECLYCDILGYDTVYSGRRVLVCRRRAEEDPPDTLVNSYHNTRCQMTENQDIVRELIRKYVKV